MKSSLSQEQRTAVSRISGLVLANAMIFQEVLAESNEKVYPLQKILDKDNIQKEFSTHWKYIIDKIDYYAIFDVARKILSNISSSQAFAETLRLLAVTAQEIVQMRAALRHDLMGRIYHRLLVEKKYLGTYYTSIPAATMLLRLSLRPRSMHVDWHRLTDIKKLRIADLACGTGTLLMAAADAVADNYVSECAARGRKIDAGALHAVLLEQTLYGYDVLASAVHLTASTLALRSPQVSFTDTHLYSLPLGGSTECRLGSIEYLMGRQVGMPYDLFGTKPRTKRIRGKSVEEPEAAPLPDLDLCVMNPPFTRSVGSNLLFGSLPPKERERAQQELKKLVKKKRAPANITAGLGSVFVATAHPYVRKGGRIALVLPKALLSGVAWEPTRQLIYDNYELEYVISSHDPQRWNFSESTSLSETLLVAKKSEKKSRTSSHRITAVNLWSNPTTAFQAMAVAHQIIDTQAPDLEAGQGALSLSIGSEKVGEAISVGQSVPQLSRLWMLPCAFAQSDLVRISFHLVKGVLRLPGVGKTGKIPLCSMNQLATLGPDRRDIHDGFELSSARTQYPTLWGHRTKAIVTMAHDTSQFLSPLAVAKKGRRLRKVEHLWPLSGRLLMAERLRLNTCRVVAVRTPKPALSNVWWSAHPNSGLDAASIEKILVLWLNSTLGLIMLLVHREETEGALVGLKKPVLEKLPVLDVRSLSSIQVRQLVSCFDSLSGQPLLPLPEMAQDQIKAKIDAQIGETLGTPDFTNVRQLLSQEPIICLQRL